MSGIGPGHLAVEQNGVGPGRDRRQSYSASIIPTAQVTAYNTVKISLRTSLKFEEHLRHSDPHRKQFRRRKRRPCDNITVHQSISVTREPALSSTDQFQPRDIDVSDLQEACDVGQAAGTWFGSSVLVCYGNGSRRSRSSWRS